MTPPTDGKRQQALDRALQQIEKAYGKGAIMQMDTEFSAAKDGISTGALIATFAFLGPAYDDVIRSHTLPDCPPDLYRTRRPLSLLFADSLVTVEPLKQMIEAAITPRTATSIHGRRSGARSHRPCQGLPDGVGVAAYALVASCRR